MITMLKKYKQLQKENEELREEVRMWSSRCAGLQTQYFCAEGTIDSLNNEVESLKRKCADLLTKYINALENSAKSKEGTI